MQAPIHLRTLLYLPTRNAEKLSMQRSEPGVNLYARKVLIQARSKALVPDWLRFVKGNVHVISRQIILSLCPPHPIAPDNHATPGGGVQACATRRTFRSTCRARCCRFASA